MRQPRTPGFAKAARPSRWTCVTNRSGSGGSVCFDPAGVWIDVVEQIESAPGWWDRYLPA